MTTQHRIVIDGPPLVLADQTWKCSCGGWMYKMPNVGPFGNTSAKARIAQANMAHAKHVKAANAVKVKK